jgi:hypothetical protein
MRPRADTRDVSATPYSFVTSCTLCHVPAPLEHMTPIQSGRVLCVGCIGAVEAAVALTPEQQE